MYNHYKDMTPGAVHIFALASDPPTEGEGSRLRNGLRQE